MFNTRKVTINNNEYEFINECGSRGSYGFYHYTELFKNGIRETTNRCNYINRTWENYQYQSVMLGAIYNLIEHRTELLKEIFKEVNGYKKLTKTRLEEFEKELAKDKQIEELKQLRTEIRGNVW